MKEETENAIRSIASLDPEVSTAMVDRAIDIMRGRSEECDALIHNVKFKDAQDLLKVSRRTLSHYLDHGYLDRVYGGGRKNSMRASCRSRGRLLILGISRFRDILDLLARILKFRRLMSLALLTSRTSGRI